MMLRPASLMRLFAHHGRTFHFASRLLSPADRARVASIYAYCRLTDDLVDESGDAPAAEVHARLDAWLDASRHAYAGGVSGIDAIDRAMADMRAHEIPIRYAEELVAGTRADIEGPAFDDVAALHAHTFQVAGVVGLWMTEAFGVREPWVLDRAAALGHAMQITNIVRDVGDDWRRGRLYLPATLMRSYGLHGDDIDAMYRGERRITPAFRAVLEAMMAIADAHYRVAFEAMGELPPAFRRSVAVAAEVYRGIHAEVRRLDYDTVRSRAFTSTPRKMILAGRGLRRLRAASVSPERTYLHAPHGVT